MEKPAVLQQLDDIQYYSTSKSNGVDEYGIASEVDLKRKDGTLILKSVLSGGNTPAYTTRTETYYSTDGTTPIKTIVYALSYDSDNNLISEVMQ